MDSVHSNSIPCPLCGDFIDQRRTKNGKPYFHCDPCGTQYFVRKPRGIKLLEELKKKIESGNWVFPQKSPEVIELQQLITEYEQVSKEIQRLPSFFRTDDHNRILKSL